MIGAGNDRAAGANGSRSQRGVKGVAMPMLSNRRVIFVAALLGFLLASIAGQRCCASGQEPPQDKPSEVKGAPPSLLPSGRNTNRDL